MVVSDVLVDFNCKYILILHMDWFVAVLMVCFLLSGAVIWVSREGCWKKTEMKDNRLQIIRQQHKTYEKPKDNNLSNTKFKDTKMGKVIVDEDLQSSLV